MVDPGRCYRTKRRIFLKGTFMKQILGTVLILAVLTRASIAVDLNTARIGELTGLKGKLNEKEGVYKITFPRSDVKVVVDGWTMPPFMGLGTWRLLQKAHTPTQW